MSSKDTIEFDVQNRSMFSLEQIAIKTSNGIQIPENIQRPMSAMGTTHIAYSVPAGREVFS